MNDPIDDRRVSQTHQALRDEPPQALDAAVLAAAKRALAEDAAARATGARWRRWTPAFAVAATVTLGLALSLQLLFVPEPMQEEDLEQPPAARQKVVLERPRAAQDNSDSAPAAAAEPVATPIELPKMDMPLSGGAGGAVGSFGPPPAVSPVAEMKAEKEAARAEIAADAARSMERVEVTGARAKRAEPEPAPQAAADAPVAAQAPAAPVAAEAPAMPALAAPAPTPASHAAVYPREALYSGPKEVRSVEKWRADIKALLEAGKTDEAHRETREMCQFYRQLAECKQ